MMRTFWTDVEKMHSEMDDLFNFMYGRPRKTVTGPVCYRQPLCSMDWKENKLHTELELPGVDKKEIELNVADGFLEVKVDAKEEMDKTDNVVKSNMISRPQFYRKLQLPESVDTRNVIAEFHNGLLSIDIPKLEIEKEEIKRIDIK